MDNWKLERNVQDAINIDINYLFEQLIDEVQAKESIIEKLQEEIDSYKEEITDLNEKIDLLQEQLNNIE